jgi:hypothetical protein
MIRMPKAGSNDDLLKAITLEVTGPEACTAKLVFCQGDRFCRLGNRVYCKDDVDVSIH